MSDTVPLFQEETPERIAFREHTAEVMRAQTHGQITLLKSGVVLPSLIDIGTDDRQDGLAHPPDRQAVLEPDSLVPDSYEDQLQKFDRQCTFFREAFEEVKDRDAVGRTIHGPLHKDLNAILGRCSQLLAFIGRSLPPEVLIPSTYQSGEIQHLMDTLKWNRPQTYWSICDLREAKKEALKDFMGDRLAELMPQTIPEGLLGVPPFISQYGDRSCVSTTFLMVLEAITREPLNRQAFDRALRHVYRSDIVHDTEYLKLLQSDTLKRRYGINIHTVSFIGADLATIAKLAAAIRNKLPGHQIYCVVPLLSDSFEETARRGIWHSNVLLGANERWVEVHDPATRYGEPNRKIPKKVFYQRWAQAYLQGHLVIAEA